jgi:ubiquinone/menaquinone biosynthesis C-methylase UbiE
MNQDTWAAGEKYERYVGRWSRPVADAFFEWLASPSRLSLLDVGCGTGALSRTILEKCSPESLHGIDPSAAFIDHARNIVHEPRAVFAEGGAESIPFEEQSFDIVASGLALNFVPNPRLGLSEMVRVTRPGGTLAVYIWDYADKMELIRYFWDAAVELNSSARELNEALRFPICNQEALCALFEDAGLEQVEARNIDVPTKFENFDDYRTPFLGGQGPAPGYAMGLESSARDGLRDLLERRLPANSNGSISLMARALAVRGVRTQG